MLETLWGEGACTLIPRTSWAALFRPHSSPAVAEIPHFARFHRCFFSNSKHTCELAPQLLISVTSPPRQKSVSDGPLRILFIDENNQKSTAITGQHFSSLHHLPAPGSGLSSLNKWFCTTCRPTGSLSHQAGSGLLAC